MTDELRNDQRDLIEYLRNGHISIAAIMDYMIEKKYANHRLDVGHIDDCDHDVMIMTFYYSIYYDYINLYFEIIEPQVGHDYSTIEMKATCRYLMDEHFSEPETVASCILEIKHFDDIDMALTHHRPKFLRKAYRELCKKRNEINYEDLKKFNISQLIREFKEFKEEEPEDYSEYDFYKDRDD